MKMRWNIPENSVYFINEHDKNFLVIKKHKLNIATIDVCMSMCI